MKHVLPIFLFLAAATVAHATVSNFGAARDNSIYEDFSTNSNGSGPTVFAGTNIGNATRRGLMAFDLTLIPSGSVIESVSLTLFLVQAQAFATTVDLHRVTSAWGEGTSNPGNRGGAGAAPTENDATWEHTFYNTSLWNTQGGDFIATSSAVTNVGAEGSAYTWASTPQLIADVQLWVDNPSTNFGWMLRGDESQSGTAKAFGSRENGTTSHRPQLTVTYTPVPEPTIPLLGGLALLGAILKWRRVGTR